MEKELRKQNKHPVYYTVLIALSSILLMATFFFSIDYGFTGVMEFVKLHPFVSGAVVVISIVTLLMVLVYMGYIDRKLLESKRYFTVTVIAIELTVIATVAMARFVHIEASPLLLAIMLVAVLVDKRVAVFVDGAIAFLLFTLLLCMKMTSSLPVTEYSIELIASNMFAGVLTVIVFSKVHSRVGAVMGGCLIAIVSAPITACLTAVVGGTVSRALEVSLYCLFGNVVSVLLFLFLLPLFESLFKICTDFKLDEYCSMNAPLLKRLKKEAPGTFNHSLLVASLAESCANEIGENPMLARACAYYHDVGKLKNAEFFIENQGDGKNPHDDLVPENSAKIITKHTEFGAELLTKHRFPNEIVDVALTHHGTSVTGYFYKKAQIITDGNADPKDYSYSGPKVSTKVGAIISICDAVEAAMRSAGDEKAGLIESIIKGKFEGGQFSDCPITLRELSVIGETLAEVVSAIYHKRISYDRNLFN